MNEPLPQDLQDRMLQLLDGELNRDEVAQLDAEMRNDPQARQLYLQLAELHNALHVRCTSRAEIGQSPLVSIENLIVRQRRHIFRRSLMAAAAILVISIVPLWLLFADRRPATLARFEIAQGSVFTLSHSGKNGEPPANTLCAGSRIHLTSGLLEGKFESGVSFVVEAPCDLEVLAKDRITLAEGIGWFNVPSSAIGFTVETPQMNIVDLGTQFGIIALRDKSPEIHVLKGKVEAGLGKAQPGENKLLLEEGQARRLDEIGNFVETPMDSARFTTSIAKALIVKNGNFDVLGNLSNYHDKVGYGPIDHWGTSGLGVGINDITQPFLEQPAHSGTHAAFIQSKGAISQSVSGFDPSKLYTVTYFVSERGFVSEQGPRSPSTRTSVSLDLGTTFYTQPDLITKTTAFRRIVSGPLAVFGPTANIEIRAQTITGDAALLIDSVSITRAVQCVPDGGFENPVQPPSSFKQAVGIGSGTLTGSAWTFLGGGGITTKSSPMAPPTIPEGSQTALLQNLGAAIETTIQDFEPGVTYSLSLETTRRRGGLAPFQILLDDKILTFNGSTNLAPPVGRYQTFTSQNFTVSQASQKLRIVAMGEGISFIDDIRFNFVAEASE